MIRQIVMANHDDRRKWVEPECQRYAELCRTYRYRHSASIAEPGHQRVRPSAADSSHHHHLSLLRTFDVCLCVDAKLIQTSLMTIHPSSRRTHRAADWSITEAFLIKGDGFSGIAGNLVFTGPTGIIQCSNGVACPAGTMCCGGGCCLANNGQCCPTGGCCQQGSHCCNGRCCSN